MPTKHEKTLIDEFAMAALPALIMWYGEERTINFTNVVKIAYDIGDSMMKEREKHMPETKQLSMAEVKDLMQE